MSIRLDLSKILSPQAFRARGLDYAVVPASYIVFKGDDGKTYVKNGRTGAIEYSSSDDADAIQRAIDRAGAEGGGRVVLRGRFTIDVTGRSADAVTLRSGVELVGLDASIAVVGKPSKYINLFGVVGSPSSYLENVGIRGLRIDLTNAESITAIFVAYARKVVISDNEIVDTCNDSSKGSIGGMVVGVYGANVKYMNYDVYILRNRVDFRGVRNSPPVQIYWSQRVWEVDNFIKGSDPDVTQRADFVGLNQMQGVRDVVIRGNYFYRGHHNAIYFADSSSAGFSSENVIIEGNIFVEPQDDHIDPNNDKKMVIANNVFIHGPASLGWVTPEDNCEDIVIVGNYMYGPGYIAIISSRRVTVAGNIMIQPTRARNYISVKDSEDVVVEGNVVYNSPSPVIVGGTSRHVIVKGNIARLAAYNDSFVTVGDSASRVTVEGNIVDVLDGSWGNIAYIKSTSVNKVIIRNNMRGALGRLRGPRLESGVSPYTQAIVANVYGPDGNIDLEYATAQSRNAGVATITAGSTRVTVSHGLVSAPSKVLITPLGAPPGKLWVENITSISFDIVTDTAPSADLNVAWYAEV